MTNPKRSSADHAKQELHAAWDDLMTELASARDAIDHTELMPPPPSDRHLAEGYRYLMGFVHSAIERAFHADPRFPSVRHALQIVNKGTIDNPDAIYFMAPIDGRQSYVLRGNVDDHRHWRGAARAPKDATAPQYIIFEVSDGCIAGDTGSLAELRPGVKAQTGKLDSTQLEVGSDGRFEILLAPERPADHRGNFISTYRRATRPNPEDPDGSLDRYAQYVSGRQLFYDWEREHPVHLRLERIGSEGEAPEIYTPERAADELRRMGALVRGQMHFWNQFYGVLLETYGKPDGSKGERFMPRNAFNAPNAASGATGGGQSTNIYAGGVYELAPDEVLLIENRIPVAPQYTGAHLSSLWGESHDFANHQSSLNGFQTETDRDGVIRFIVAHRDPGVPNWLDTTGHPEGFLTARWTYAERPPEEEWPTISTEKIGFDEIRARLPEETRSVTPAERSERIRWRREHVQRRYRVF